MLNALRPVAAASIALLAVLVPAAPAVGGGVTCTGALSTVPAAAVDGAQVGASIGLAGTDVLVGAPGQAAVFLYRRGGAGTYAAAGSLGRPAALSAASGFGTDIAVDGTVAAVGAPYHNSSQGAVVLYSRAPNGAWSVLQTITSPVSLSGGCFGLSVAMNGGFLAIGAPAVVNAAGYARGAVYLYERLVDGTYGPLVRFDPNASTQAQDKFFGWSVGLCNSVLAVAAPGELLGTDAGKRGSVYVYRRAETGLWPALVRLKTAGAATGSYGTDMAVGSQESNGSGVSIFVRQQRPLNSDTVWQYRMGVAGPSLTGSATATASPAFGGAPQSDSILTNTMAIHEGVGFVGSPNYSGTNSRVDEFVFGGTSWAFLASIPGPAGTGSGFGQGVGIGHDQFAVGAPSYEAALNKVTGLVSIGTHAEPDCNVDGVTDACAIALTGQDVIDVDIDGIPDGCELVGTPSVLVATSGSSATAIGVTWSAVHNASSYRLTRVDGALEVPVATTYVPQYLDTGVAPGVKTVYRVRAVSPDGTLSDGFATDYGWRMLAPPTGVSASDGTSMTGVNVAWNAVEGATSYKVMRLSGSAETVLATGVVGLSYEDTTAVANVTYGYRIQALGTDPGEIYSAKSTTDAGRRAASSAPLTVSATDGTSTSAVTVTWTAPTGGDVGYRILRGIGAATPTDIGTVAAGVRTFTDTSVPVAGQVYRYYVRLQNAASGGIFNTGWMAAIGPASVTAADGTATTGVAITWPAAPADTAATAYVIYRAAPGAGAVVLAQVAKTVLAYTDTTAQPGVNYTYTVRANSPFGLTFPVTDTGWRRLATPTGLTATTTLPTKVTLAWTAVTNATGYEITRVGPGGTDTFTTALPTYADASGDWLQTYTYTVKATCALGSSAATASVNGRRGLNTPTGLVATDTLPTKVTVSWTAVANATGYQVTRTGPGDTTVTFNTATTSYADTTGTWCEVYTYSVKATCAQGQSAGSATDAGRRGINAPSGFVASNNNPAKVALSWAAVANATGYRITRVGPGDATATFTTTALAYADTGAAFGTEYTYAVQATCAQGQSASSATDTGSRTLATPTGLAATDNLTTRVTVTWAAVTYATAYQVRRVDPSDVAVTFNTTTTSYADTSAVPGTTYTYSVKATCAQGSSPFSATDTGIRVPAFRFAGAPGGDAAGNSGRAGGAEGVSSGGRAGAVAGTGDRAQPADPTALHDGLLDDEGRRTWLVDGVKLVQGLFFMDDADRMVVALRAPSDAPGASMLVVTGDASLAGELVVAFDGYEPKAGDRWTIVLAARLDGDFRTVHVPALPEGLRLEAVPMGATFEVRVVSSEE